MLKIIRDTREQFPFQFADYPVEIVEGTLSAGDYSLYGFESAIAVERKALGDLVSCLSSGRNRFMRELDRLRGYESAVIVVEADFKEVANGGYRSRLNPKSATQSIISIMQAFRMPFFFAGGHREAERFTFDFLRHFARHAERRYKAIQNMKPAQ